MKQIHGKLTPEKVDETMYAVPSARPLPITDIHGRASMAKHDRDPGTSYGSKMRSAKRSSTPSRATKSESPSTRRTSRRSWTSCSRSSWTSRCSRPEQCRCRIRSNGSPPHPKTVSLTLRATRRLYMLTCRNSQGQDAGCGTGGRRRGRAAEAASRNGHVRSLGQHGEQIQCQQDITRACQRTFGLVTEVDKEQGDCPEQMGKKNCFGESFRDRRWRTGGCIRDCEGNRGQKGGSQLYKFPNHVERPIILPAPSYLTGRMEDTVRGTA